MGLTQNALASCNPKTDIVKTGNNYQISKDCYVEFGRLVQVEKDRKQQVKHLNESIELKDLAIDTSNKRIRIWQDATYKVEDRLIRLEKNTNTTKWVYFGLGILTMTAATYGASKLK